MLIKERGAWVNGGMGAANTWKKNSPDREVESALGTYTKLSMQQTSK